MKKYGDRALDFAIGAAERRCGPVTVSKEEAERLRTLVTDDRGSEKWIGLNLELEERFGSTPHNRPGEFHSNEIGPGSTRFTSLHQQR